MTPGQDGCKPEAVISQGFGVKTGGRKRGFALAPAINPNRAGK
jgi:hypothetical protein